MNADYWNDLYAKGDTGWDKGQPAPPIVRLLGEVKLPPGARIGVLGAGKGHEALAAARAGFRVSAIDFAPLACEAIAKNAAAANLNVEVLEEDVFTLFKRRPKHYDGLIEHTCFCAIPVERRAEFVEAVHALLSPGRGVLFGLFYAHGREGGPPFDTNAAEVRTLFSPHFELQRLEVAKDSFEARAGKELEAIFVAR